MLIGTGKGSALALGTMVGTVGGICTFLVQREKDNNLSQTSLSFAISTLPSSKFKLKDCLFLNSTTSRSMFQFIQMLSSNSFIRVS